ncbi:MAG TPA: hypothetical protein VFH95_08905 [Candidatus Kapabacteria bacterium]|nr:hypothetical protein [Candidatus Kapabacteria bacterium]
MISHLAGSFRRLFAELPQEVQDLARKNYRLWMNNPHHPGLEFKRVNPVEPIYSVRVGNDWRALGEREGNVIVRFWIGSHSDYDKILDRIGR